MPESGQWVEAHSDQCQVSGDQTIHSSDPQSPSPDYTGLTSGDQSAVEPPGPIPNPEVKRRSANGSETIGLVRVGRRQVYARLQAVKCSEPGSFLSTR
jgi:hypothetical protein